jgi:hypothetical protein
MLKNNHITITLLSKLYKLPEFNLDFNNILIPLYGTRLSTPETRKIVESQRDLRLPYPQLPFIKHIVP